MAQPQTRADLPAQRVLAYHFFQSRQWVYLVKMMADHPFMINLYMNATEELEEISRDWPPYMRGFVDLFTGPGGRRLFINPMALFSTYGLFEQTNFESFGDEDQSRLERFVKWGDKYLGWNPAFANMFNLSGALGDIWAPDLVGVHRETNLLTLMINTGRAYGLIGDDPAPVGNIYTDTMSKVRELTSGIIPGTEEVESRSSEQSMDAEIRLIMVDELERDGIDPESDEGIAILTEAYENPDSELYKRSVKRWIAGEWFEEGAKVAGGFMRPRTRIVDENDEDVRTNLGDIARGFVNAPSKQVTAFRSQQNKYYEIGNDRTQAYAGVWSDVAFGRPMGNVVVDGITYTPEEVMAMDPEDRMALADGLLSELGLLDDVNQMRDERNKFLAQPENAEYAQYDTWKDKVRDYPGGPEQYWQDLIAQNENARAYYNAYIKDEEDPAKRERMMRSNNAFFHLKAWDHNAYDKPLETYGSDAEIWDPVGVANTQPQPIPYEEPNAEFRNEAREAPVFQAELQQYDDAFRNRAVQMGYPYNVSIPDMRSKDRIAIEDSLKADGIYEPKPPFAVEKYLEWVEKQPAGADVSLDAFFAADQEAYENAAPQRATEKINTPAAAPGPDQYGTTAPSASSDDFFWETIFGLLNQHDHNRYKDPWARP